VDQGGLGVEERRAPAADHLRPPEPLAAFEQFNGIRVDSSSECRSLRISKLENRWPFGRRARYVPERVDDQSCQRPLADRPNDR
jgi:hypothetical protein